MALQLNTITANIPSNVFNPSDVCVFQAASTNSIIKNRSFYVCGDFVLQKATAFLSTDEVFYDGFVGAQSFFKQIMTKFDGRGGVVETQSNYPLYQKIKSQGSKFLYAHGNNTDTARELKTGDNVLTRQILQGIRYADGTCRQNTAGTVYETRNKFTMWLDIACNNTTTDIPFQFIGNLEIQLRVNDSRNVLFGANAGDYTFRLENLTLNYKTYQTEKPVMIKELTFLTSSWGTQNVTNNGVIQITNNDPILAAYAVFLRNSVMNDSTSNKLDLALLPEVSQVIFALNSLQSTLNFPIQNESEIMYHALRGISLGNFKESSFIYDFVAKKGFAIGILLPALTDTSRSPLQMYITSLSNNAQDYQANYFSIGQRTIM